MVSKIDPKTLAKTATPSEYHNHQGWVFDIKRFSVHDGPGIRTTIFLKGCSLRCVWCHNPESINSKPEILIHPMKCISCGTCFKICPKGAHRITASGERTFDRVLCDLCGRCVESCYAEALVMAGRRVSVDDVMAVVREDAEFYEISGGGVTLSGGEPLLQREFASTILQHCRAEGFHTAVETCGQVGWKVLEESLQYVDLWLYDLKHISPRQHKKYTGASNRLILDNLRRLSDHNVPIEVHMLIVPTINDSEEDIESAARFLASLKNITVRLLTYHRLAGSKYQSLGRHNTMPDVTSPSRRHLLKIARWIGKYGLNVVVPEKSISQRPAGDHDVGGGQREGNEVPFYLGDEEKRPW
jgi:pyruvate formate lyase activating enzyme